LIAVQCAWIVELSHNRAIACRHATGTTSTLKNDPIADPSVDGHVDSIPMLNLIAEIAGEFDDVIDHANFIRVEIVKSGDLVTPAARQTRDRLAS
jgi:hypothetical protein